MAGKPRISTPFIQRLSSLRGSTKLEIARKLLEYPSITKSDADVLFSIADRFDWSETNFIYMNMAFLMSLCWMLARIKMLSKML